MGPVSWLVAIGCLFIGSGVGIWGFTDVNRLIAIWLVGFPGAICLIIAACVELQNSAASEKGPRADSGRFHA